MGAAAQQPFVDKLSPLLFYLFTLVMIRSYNRSTRFFDIKKLNEIKRVSVHLSKYKAVHTIFTEFFSKYTKNSMKA